MLSVSIYSLFFCSPVQPVKCPECNRNFKNNKALNGHMRLHGGFDWTKKVSFIKRVLIEFSNVVILRRCRKLFVCILFVTLHYVSTHINTTEHFTCIRATFFYEYLI